MHDNEIPSGGQETIPPEEKSAMPNEIRIGGIEGGGTHSSLIVMDGDGKELTHIKGPGTNHWQLGMEETAKRINSMISEAKKNMGIPETYRLDCVGLCLSGCEEEESNAELVKILLDVYPDASKEYFIGSDTMGSLKTGSDSGGVVLIAGTGSNGLLINSDGSTHGCGGWGHMMGDEGSAFWMAHKACKYVFDDKDGLQKAPEAISYVWPAMRAYFRVQNQHEMLPHLYNNFDKSKLAMFTKELAIGCEANDPLCLLIFSQAGKYLAKHLNALYEKAHDDLKLQSGGIKAICVGSVWKSWNFMKEAFIQEIHDSEIIEELTLVSLKASSAIGACYAASEKIKCESFIRTHAENTNAFFHYNRKNFPPNRVRFNVENICVAGS